MKSLKRIALALLVVYFLSSESSIGQQQNLASLTTHPVAANATKTNFVVKPFQPTFIENKGQYDRYEKGSSNHPAYGGQMGKTIVLFSKNSVQFVENINKKEAEGKEEEEHKFEQHRQTMTFVDANKDASFITDEKEGQYFTFPDAVIKNGTLKADGWKSLTEKNVYPGIDVAYSFQKEGGIKYSFIVHPGADASVIKIKWSGVEAVGLDESGNLQLHYKGGLFVDNAPISYYEGDEKSAVASTFKVNGKTVSFLLSDYDHGKTLIIDPWVHDPNFATYDGAFDIQHDPSGNIYVYGGANPYQIQKYTSLGSPIWTYNTSAAGYYGDFTLDAGGNCYIVYGPWGDLCLKLDPGGILVWSVITSAPSVEIYRIFPNPVSGKLTVMGMELHPSQAPLVFTVDPATGAHSPYSFHPTCLHGEVRCMSVDANGDAFGLSFSSGFTGADTTNLLWKVDASNATTGSVQDGYLLYEGQASNTSSEFSGFNGTAVSGCSLFTYDGLTVKKWDKVTLALQGSVNITGGIAYTTGGLCTDSCGNVYVGGPDSIIEFDGNLVHLAAVATTGNVYDVNNGSVPGEILACGQSFFGSYTFPICTVSSSSISENVTIVSCTNPVILHPTSTGVSYLWNTGATTDSISVSVQGQYWVHVLGATVCNQVVTIADTFNVSFALPPVVNLGLDHSVCGAGPDTLRGGNPGDTYLWSTGATTQNISITTTGTYWVAVNNGGCTGYDTVTVTFVASPTVNLGPDTTICSNATITLNAGNTGFNFLWNTGATTQTITVNTAGTYSVYVSQSVCHGRDTINVTLVNPPVVNIGPDSTICSNQTITLNAGNAGSTFSWSTGATTQSISANTTGVYSVVVSNAACSGSDTTSITVIQMPVVNLGHDSTLCVGETISIDAGNTGYLYHWSTGETTETITVTTAGNYWVVVNLGLCVSDDTVHIHYIAPPIVNLGNDTVVCSPNPVTLNSGTTGNTYLWVTGAQTPTITVNTPGIYWVVVNNGSCSRTDSVIVSVVTPPVVLSNFVADTTNGCNPLTIHFTNNSAGGLSYLWRFGDNQTSTLFNPNHQYTSAGFYTVTLVVTNDTSTVCGEYIDSLVYIHYIAVENPVVVTSDFIRSPVSGCSPLDVDITNGSTNGTAYFWDFGNGIQSLDSVPGHAHYHIAGNYTITLIAFHPSAVCYSPPDTIKLDITADSCNLYTPNVFSPNADGKNDYFNLLAEGFSDYHLLIFNRWGLKVFESIDHKIQWNGKVNNTGGDCPDGTYYYIFTGIDFNKAPYADHGFITLIR